MKVDEAKTIIEEQLKNYCLENIVGKSRNAREYSWCNCYEEFGNAFEKVKTKEVIDINELALQLGFFLASWGMYTRRTFLLDYNHEIHKDAVEILISHSDLRFNEISVAYESSRVDSLKNELIDSYKVYKKNQNTMSEILISKIILGTLGCTPAYDTNFVIGLRRMGAANRSFKLESINELKLLCIECKDIFGHHRICLKERTGIEYPDMKLLDMAIWQYGKRGYA